MALVLWMAHRGAGWKKWGRRLSVAVTAAVSALMATLFGLMAVATDHNDTWWNADVVWALGGWGVIWVAVRRSRGVRPEAMGLERKVATVWTMLALGSVSIAPVWRSGLGWGEATVWASVGACLAVVFAVWTSLALKVR